MRKSILLVAATALLASCNDVLMEDVTSSAQKNAAGVTFEVIDGTRGMVQDGKSFFFAELDRVDIYAHNALSGYPSFGTPQMNFANKFQYKATSSQGNPLLTGIDDANILGLKDVETNEFFIAYPQGQTVTPTMESIRKFTVDPGFAMNVQYMNNGYQNFDARLLYQYTTVEKENFYDAVGQNIQLYLKSPMAMLEPFINDITEYAQVFGKLTSVSITSKDEALVPARVGMQTVISASDITNVGGTNYLTASLDYTYPACVAEDLVEIPQGSGITYIKATCYLDEFEVWHVTNLSIPAGVGDDNPTKDKIYSVGAQAQQAEAGQPLTIGGTTNDKFEITSEGTMTFVKGDCDAMATKVTLNIDAKSSAAIEAENGKRMNIFVLPSEKATRDYVISYSFEKVTLTYDKTLPTEIKAGERYGLSLNIADKFPYIVTLGNQGSGRTLIVNSGSLKNVLNAGSTKVKWTDEFATNGEVDFSSIKEIYIKGGVSNLDAADWTALNKFNAATILTIQNGTPILESVSGMSALKALYANNIQEVKANAFNNVSANIEHLYLNSVRKYGDAANKFAALKILSLESYEFIENEETASAFFNDNVKNTLQYCHINSCTSLAPLFGHERKILFTNYASLKEIYLNSTKTILAADEFKGCTSLAKVIGNVDIESAENAFEGCIALAEVNVTGTEIPAGAFKNSAVKNIKLNGGDQVAPTMIGAEAFMNDQAIELMDLTNIEGTNLGKAAFMGANKFVGSNAASSVVTLNITEVPENAFNGTKVIRFQLKKATKTANNSLASTALKQIKYRKDLNASNISSSQVLTPANVEIFVQNAEDRAIFLNLGYVTVAKEDWDW